MGAFDAFTGAITGVHLATGVLAKSGPSGLAIVETEISEVLTTLKTQRAKLEDSDFRDKGIVAGSSYGNGGEAAMLAHGHTRAHKVTVQTIDGLISDLTELRAAIKDAKALIYETDQQSRDELTLILQQTESNDLSLYDHQQAQVDNQNVTNPDVEDQP